MNQEILSLDSIIPDPDQPRSTIDAEELKPLAMSIRDLGQLQPIIVYRQGDQYCLMDGHRRFQAKRLIGQTHVMALIHEKKPDADAILTMQLAANCLRVDLKPTEKALSFKRLKESRGWTNVELAKAMYTSKSTVTQILSYLTLPDEVKQKLDAGELAGSTAYAISRAPDEASAQKLITKAVNGNLKRDDANRDVAGKEPKVRSTFRMEKCDVCIVAFERIDLLGAVAILQQLAREGSKAANNNHDVKSFERALALKRNAAS